MIKRGRTYRVIALSIMRLSRRSTRENVSSARASSSASVVDVAQGVNSPVYARTHH